MFPRKLFVIAVSALPFLAYPTSPRSELSRPGLAPCAVPVAGSARLNEAGVTQAYGKLPLLFEPNRGQTDRQVKFLARSAGQTIFLTPTALVLSMHSKPGGEPAEARSEPSGARPRRSERPGARAAVRLNLLASNPDPKIESVSEQSGKNNYLIGNDPAKWRTDVPQYGKVRYKDVYPGVDWVFRGNQRQLEYDFVVAPGADPRAIRLRLEGAQSLKLDRGGDLVLETAAGELRQKKPFIYQEIDGSRREIAGRYLLQGQEVRFEVAAYDQTRPLVIDPLLYSTYLGGSDFDRGLAIAVDRCDNAYVTGQTQSTDFPFTTGAFQTGNAGSCDAFVTKMTSDGSSLAYSTFLGGTSCDFGRAIAVDFFGQAYITGQTGSTDFPTTHTAFSRTYSGGTDAFVTVLSAGGNFLVYSTYLGGSAFERGRGIAVDSLLKIYVAGETQSTNFPTKNGFQSSSGGGSDAWMVKLDPAASGAASLLYGTYLGGSSFDRALAIAVDGHGFAYIAGTASSGFPTRNAFQSSIGGTTDAFVAKLNPALAGDASLLYSTFFGGTGSEEGRGIAVDDLSDIYFVGRTDSTAATFPLKNAFQAANGGGSDAFLARLRPSNAGAAQLIYSSYLGGSGFERGRNVAVGGFGTAYLTGQTQSSDFPTKAAIQGTFGGGSSDAFVAEFNTSLSGASSLIYSTFLGGNGSDEGRGIAVDSCENAFVTGRTSSPAFCGVALSGESLLGDQPVSVFCPPSLSFPTTPGAFQTFLFGGIEDTDAFVSKIGPGCSSHIVHGHISTVEPTHSAAAGSPHAHHNQHNHTACPGDKAGAVGRALVLASPDPGEAASSTSAESSANTEGSNTGFVAGLNEDGTLNGDPATPNVSGAKVRPIRRGEVLQLFGSSAGLILGEQESGPDARSFTPPASGQPLYYTTLTPEVLVGTLRAKVLFSGLAPGLAGTWQLNIQIPESASGGLNVPLTIFYDGELVPSVGIAVDSGSANRDQRILRRSR